MATYLKRTSKLFDLSLGRTFAEVNLRDLMCPVCRGILIEPVTLPCTHNLCLRCLKGTFEHNSLSCPLCRVRVGSWLRTATKSETLVNNELWELIRAKFPKEVEDKHNGDDGDIELDARFSTADTILSAAGEIRREYEAQLQMAEEEFRRQRKAEQIASEALIRKIQEEEEQHLAQLAQDQLLAKTLAKKEVVEKQKDVRKSYELFSSASQNCIHEPSKIAIRRLPVNSLESVKIDNPGFETGNMNLSQLNESLGVKRAVPPLVSTARTEKYASMAKGHVSNAYKDSSVKFCCQKPMPVYNAITRTLKHQVKTKFTQPSTSNYTLDPGCSTSKIYGTQSKEELHVPSDVLRSKKKCLGVEVCMTVGDDDERIGSAESAGSHDSINQEIHHFKPIKAMPRTPLKLSADGRQIDPKLIRVIPILKRTSNAVLKPPSPTHLKRIIGCSWSAFRGRAKQDVKRKGSAYNPQDLWNAIDEKPSTSLNQQQTVSNKSTKSQISDTARRVELGPEMSFDSNKNYAKNINRIINGTKVSKKLLLDEFTDSGKLHKAWTMQPRNGAVGKYDKQKLISSNKKVAECISNEHDVTEIDAEDSSESFASTKRSSATDALFDTCEDNVTIESIAERIKRRKETVDKKSLQTMPNVKAEFDSDTGKRRTRKRTLSGRKDDESVTSEQHLYTTEKQTKARSAKASVPRSKRQRMCRRKQYSDEIPQENNSSVDANCKTIVSVLRKSMRNLKSTQNDFKSNDVDIEFNTVDDTKCNYKLSELCKEKPEYRSVNNNTNDPVMNVDKHEFTEENVILEQERMERLVLQEKQDFELAQRLQEKFDEMERIAGRTRQSKKAIESGNTEIDLFKIKVERIVCKGSGTFTATQSTINQTTSSETKQRGRPRKRVK